LMILDQGIRLASSLNVVDLVRTGNA